MAQLAEQLNRNQQVGGSIPSFSTIEQSILTFVRFKHIVSTSKEVDFLHLMKERIDFDD